MIRCYLPIALIVILGSTLTPVAGAKTGDKLDRSHLVRTFADEFDSPLSLYDQRTGKGTWKTNYFFGHQDDATSRTYDQSWDIPSDPRYNGVNPFSQSEGVLMITIAKNDHPDDPKNAHKPYTSGMITTEKSFAQTYGYFEIRTALPAGNGFWPAFWLLSSKSGSAQELDVMENLGKDPRTIYCSVHQKSTQEPTNTTYTVKTASVTEMHTYGLWWTADSLIWYVDDQEVARCTNPGINEAMYLLVTIGGGGPWGGSPDATTPIPSRMRVDFVRAYSIN